MHDFVSYVRKDCLGSYEDRTPHEAAVLKAHDELP